MFVNFLLLYNNWLKSGSLRQHRALGNAESPESGMVSLACSGGVSRAVCISGENLVSSHLPHQGPCLQRASFSSRVAGIFLFLLPLRHLRTPQLSWPYLGNPGRLPHVKVNCWQLSYSISLCSPFLADRTHLQNPRIMASWWASFCQTMATQWYLFNMLATCPNSLDPC